MHVNRQIELNCFSGLDKGELEFGSDLWTPINLLVFHFFCLKFYLWLFFLFVAPETGKLKFSRWFSEYCLLSNNFVGFIGVPFSSRVKVEFFDAIDETKLAILRFCFKFPRNELQIIGRFWVTFRKIPFLSSGFQFFHSDRGLCIEYVTLKRNLSLRCALFLKK